MFVLEGSDPFSPLTDYCNDSINIHPVSIVNDSTPHGGLRRRWWRPDNCSAGTASGNPGTFHRRQRQQPANRVAAGQVHGR